MRELIPSPAQRVRIRVPRGGRVKAVRLLTSNTRPLYRELNGIVEIEVPPIELNEVIALDLARWADFLPISPSGLSQFFLVSTPAMSSTKLTMAEWSRSPLPSFIRVISICWTTLVSGSGTFKDSPASRALRRSF